MSGAPRRLVRGPDGRPEHASAVAATGGPGLVVVDVEVVLLGAEDLRGPAGPTLGREAVGVVAEVGEGVSGWHPGDRVALAAHLPCGHCPVCRSGRSTVCPTGRVPSRDADGWAAGRVAVPEHALFHVPAGLSAAEGALLPGAVATAYHALKRAGVGPGVEVAVFGEDTVAAHVVQLTALAGGRAFAFDPREAAREHALDLGAEEAFDPSVVRDVEEALRTHLGDRVDRIVLTSTGAASAADAVRGLRPGGRLVVVDTAGDGSSIHAEAAVPVGALVREDLDVVGARTATAQDVRELVDLADDGRLILAPTIASTHELADLDAIATALNDPQVLRVAVALR